MLWCQFSEWELPRLLWWGNFNPEWVTQGELNLKLVTFDVTFTCTEHSVILYMWWVRVFGNWKKWRHQFMNVILEMSGRIAWRGVSSQRSELNFSWQLLIRSFFPVLDCKLSHVIKLQERLLNTSQRKKQGPLKDMRVPQLIYSGVDQTLHLFIVCVYLLGSWYRLLCSCTSWLTIVLSGLGRCCWKLFFCYHNERKNLKRFDWTIGLQCLFTK